MGTTQRIVPGVPGQPNWGWGDLNKAITYVAKSVEAENNDDVEKTPEKEAADNKKIMDSRNHYVKSVFKNLIKTGGGSKSISSGKSKSIGRAGKKSVGKLVSFVSGIASKGLQETLREIGFGNLEGKSVQDIIDFLLIYCSESNTGMDETAAAKASCEVLNQIAEETGNDLEKFEQTLKEYIDSNKMSDTICNFWGLYIFEHLSQRFQEKLTQQKGIFVSKETFKIIKEDIIGQVKVLNERREISKIDWHSNDGSKEIEKIFESIIKILSDEN